MKKLRLGEKRGFTLVTWPVLSSPSAPDQFPGLQRSPWGLFPPTLSHLRLPSTLWALGEEYPAILASQDSQTLIFWGDRLGCISELDAKSWDSGNWESDWNDPTGLLLKWAHNNQGWQGSFQPLGVCVLTEVRQKQGPLNNTGMTVTTPASQSKICIWVGCVFGPQYTIPRRPIILCVILCNSCFSLVDDDVFKEPMRKRRRSDRDQRFRAFPSVEQSALKECECLKMLYHLFNAALFFPRCVNILKRREGYLKKQGGTSLNDLDPVKGGLGTSLVVQWLRFWAPSAEGPGLLLGRGTRPHILQPRVCMPPLGPNTAK